MSTYAPPSRDQLIARMQVTAPKMALYQASPKWFFFEHSGNPYWMPPDLGGQLTTHPVTGELVVGDGRLMVGTHYGNVYSKEAKVNPATGRRERVVVGQGPAEGETSDAIIVFVIENHGQRGVVWLEGNESDAGKIAAARKTYQRWQRESAEAQVAARRAFIANWIAQAQNKGRTVAEAPPQTDAQREAQEFLDEMSEERRLASAYICAHDGYDTNDRAKYIRHMKAAHNETVILGAEPDRTLPSDIEKTQAIAHDANRLAESKKNRSIA